MPNSIENVPFLNFRRNGNQYVNYQMLSVGAEKTLALNGKWSKTGTIEETDGTVNLGGKFTLAELGNLQLTGRQSVHTRRPSTRDS